MAKRTEKIEFDFSLWGQPGISVYHADGRKAVYVGEYSEPGYYLIHWEDKEYWLCQPEELYMTKEVDVPTLEEVTKEVHREVYGEVHYPNGMYSFSRLLLQRAQEIGIDNLLNEWK